MKIVAVVFLLTGCATVEIDDWQLSFDKCRLKTSFRHPYTTCAWKHSWLGS